MRCDCGASIPPDPALATHVKAATSYDTCIYRCSCGRGYSNNRIPSQRTCITREPNLNVPAEVVDGLDGVLKHSLNVTARTSKRNKFCFSTSEDAVTWTIFSWLAEAKALRLVPAAAGLPVPTDSAQLLLWGVPRLDGHALAEDLAAICDKLGENPKRRSEPDVILAWPSMLVFVEVKYRSPNDRQRNSRKFDRYLKRHDLFARPPEEVAGSGYYELVRNWTIGNELAERSNRSSFALLNLGPARLARQSPGLPELFSATPTQTFITLSWSSLIEAIRATQPFPAWLDAYISKRELETD